MFDSATGLVVDSTPPQTPFRVLIVGGAYGGLSAALNLQDLCSGRAPRCGEAPEDGAPPVEPPLQIAIDITIIDERDGFCASMNISPKF